MQLGSWRKHGAVRVIKAKPPWEAESELGKRVSFNQKFKPQTSNILNSTSCSKTRMTSSEPGQWTGRTAESSGSGRIEIRTRNEMDGQPESAGAQKRLNQFVKKGAEVYAEA
jgi:hypothetical protein